MKDDFTRMYQCITCLYDPKTCNCTEKDEDRQGLCLKFAKNTNIAKCVKLKRFKDYLKDYKA